MSVQREYPRLPVFKTPRLKLLGTSTLMDESASHAMKQRSEARREVDAQVDAPGEN